MENEIWMPITKPLDTKGKYQVSNYGRLKRTGYFTKIGNKWKPDLILQISKSNKYLRFNLKARGEKLTVSVHRLVCLAFLPNPENKPQVNHINADKYDNRLENLEWCTQSENIRHAQSLGIMKYAAPKKPKKMPHERKKHVVTVRKKVINIETNHIYDSTTSASLDLGISQKKLNRILSGERYNDTPLRYLTKSGIKETVKIRPIKPPKPIKEKIVRIPKPKVEKKPIKRVAMGMYDTDGNKVLQFKSKYEAARYMGTNRSNFDKQLKHSKRKYYKGFIFKPIES